MRHDVPNRLLVMRVHSRSQPDTGSIVVNLGTISSRRLISCNLRAGIADTVRSLITAERGVGMAPKHEAIDVRVGQQILWIGSDAYPLRNISRASTTKWTYRRGVTTWNYLKSVMLLAVGGALMAGILAVLEISKALPGLVIFAVLALLVVRTIRLILMLRLTLYELVIETSGASRRALASLDRSVVVDLVVRITDAINNPHAEFHMRVENFHVGDNIHQFGDQNVGKKVGA